MKKPSSAALACRRWLCARKSSHKLRWALLFAAAATTGNLTGRLMKQGGKLLGSSDALAKVSPELGKLAGDWSKVTWPMQARLPLRLR